MLWLLTALATPPLTDPTDAEWAQITEGEIVIRSAPELDPHGVYAWVEIAAAPDAIWSTINDPVKIAANNKSVESCTIYKTGESDTGGEWVGLHYVLTVALTRIEYYNLRDWHPDEGYLTWTLDPEHQHDMEQSDGHYALRPGRTEGKQILYYQSQIDSGRRLPRWLLNWLSGRALHNQLDFIRRESEG